MTVTSWFSSDDHMPTSHTTTLHEAHNDSQHLSLATPADIPLKKKGESSRQNEKNEESSSASVRSSSPSGTRNPSKVDMSDGVDNSGGDGARKEAQDLEAANGKRDVVIVDWDGPNDPGNPRK
jgi:hypothetical protein